MKQVFFLFSLLFLSGFVPGMAQSFEEGVQLYQIEEYREAAAIFEEVNGAEARLFTGKSYLALGDYETAREYLEDASRSPDETISEEAVYSLAIIYFRQKEYGKSLEYLQRLLGDSGNLTGIRADASGLYNQIIAFLSTDQRRRLLEESNSPSIRFDVVESAGNYMEPATYDSLVAQLLEGERETAYHSEIRSRLMRGYGPADSTDIYPEAPDGMIYHIGVILPVFGENDPDFTISRNLYYGMVAAAEEFNSRNANQKVRLFFKNSGVRPDTTEAAYTDLLSGKHVDAVIGPLFSEPALEISGLAEEHKIPVLPPLANSDRISRENEYTYQVNPTFEVHGKKMAQYAVEELGLRNIAILSEAGSLGASAASGFREEAQRLGATITYDFEENFETLSYDISEYTRYFTSDEATMDSLGITPSQAIYAPFTSEASSTLINLILTELELGSSDVVLLGTGEWENVNYSAQQGNRLRIYSSGSYFEPEDTESLEFFMDDYQTRFGSAPDRFARIGYDTANYLFSSLEMAGNPAYLTRIFKTRPLYEGLSVHVHFDGETVNQLINIRPLTRAARRRE